MANPLRGDAIRITRDFEATVLCPDGTPAHTLDNLRVTVLFWILEGLTSKEERRYKELYDQAYQSAEQLNRAMCGGGMTTPPGRTINVSMLKRSPQVSSICHN